MRRHSSTFWQVALCVSGAVALLAGCSDSFDNPFDGSCSATVADAASEAGDPAGSYRLAVQSRCFAGPTFGTLSSVGTWLVVPVIGDSAALSFSGTYTNSAGDALNLSISGAGVLVPGQGILVFSGSETFLGGTAVFDGSSGSAKLTNGVFGPNTSGSWAFNGTLTANNDSFEY